MKISLEAENEAEAGLKNLDGSPCFPRAFVMVHEFLVCGIGLSGRFSHLHGDPEFLGLLADFIERKVTHVGTPHAG